MAKEIFEAFEGQQEMFGFSQATKVGNTIYIAGTVGIGEGMHIPESMAGQMELAYRNVADTLAHFGARMSDVVEQRVYVTNLDEASAALEVRRAAYGGTDPPAIVDG
jgi:enamine deaminase RidA (YjgF/YER057c/UK114 family)